jgi:hypothetical protein
VPALVTVLVKVTGVPEHISLADGAIDIAGNTTGLTVIAIRLLTALLLVRQPSLDIKVHVMSSALFKAASVYVLLLTPTIAPFFFHWYTGALPSFVATAVKLTAVPSHIAGAEEVMEIVGSPGELMCNNAAEEKTPPQLFISRQRYL